MLFYSDGIQKPYGFCRFRPKLPAGVGLRKKSAVYIRVPKVVKEFSLNLLDSPSLHTNFLYYPLSKKAYQGNTSYQKAR